MIIRQSDIKSWARCPLQWKFQRDGFPREQNSALSFGTVIHDAVLVMEEAQSLDAGLERFRETWSDLSILDVEYDHLMPRQSHDGYRSDGLRILEDWWKLIQWESDVVLAREYTFSVPLGHHTLTGTVDKLCIRQLRGGEEVVLLSDYKTNSKVPTRDYLAHDIQFSAYAYASTRPEFWVNVPDGEAIFRAYESARRFGEWVHLKGPRRIDAGVREQYHYNRLLYAVDNIEASIDCGIFVPNISGETCEYCPFRRTCGIPGREAEA